MSAPSMTSEKYIYMQDQIDLHNTHTNQKSTKYNFVCCEADFLESIAVPDNSEIRFKTVYNNPTTT
jgi:hypothetical protein